MAANDCMTLDCAETDAALRRRETVRRQRRGYAFAGVATLVLTAVAPMAARAQSIGGPFTPGGHPLSVGLQFQTLFDSNTARGNDLAAAIRGLKQEDVIYTPSINVNYSSPNSREGVALRAFAGYDFYQNNTILSREHIDLSAAGNATFGRCQVGAQVAYDRGQSGLEDLTLLVTQNTIQTYTITGHETCAATTGLTQSIDVRHSGTQNSNSTLVNFDTNGVSASVGYANHTVGHVSLLVNYDKTDYQNRLAVAPGAASGLEVTSVGVQISRPIGSRLAGNAGVFYSHSSSEVGAGAPPGQNSSFDSWTSDVGLTYKVGPRLNLSGNLARDVQATIRQGASYAIDTRASIAADYTLSSRIHLNLGSSWSKQSFQGLVPVPLQTAPNRVDIWTLTAGASMQLGRNSALSGQYQHEDSNTDLTLFNFKSDRISLSISTTF